MLHEDGRISVHTHGTNWTVARVGDGSYLAKLGERILLLRRRGRENAADVRRAEARLENALYGL